MTDDHPVPDDQREVPVDDEDHPEADPREDLERWDFEAGPMSASDALRSLLSDTWQPALEVQGRMEEAGYTVDETRTARRHLAVTQAQGGVRFIDGRWHWRLAPDGCPTCGRSWHGPWAQAGGDGDYWSQARPYAAVSTSEEDDMALAENPSAPIAAAQAPPLPNYGPPRCTLCHRASAVEPGTACPFWRPDGRRCSGVVQ
jgi:hypothetical protein